MPDNVTFQATVATPPSGMVVRTKDRSGVETQVMGLDLNPGGSSEQLMSSPDVNLPARIQDLEATIRNLISVIAASPSRDAFDRVQVYLNGGVVALSAGTLTTLNTLTSITNPVYQAIPGGGALLFGQQQPLLQIAWANAVRGRIS